MTQLLYNCPTAKKNRRKLRRNQTDAEKVLWHFLRAKQLNGFRFLRQYSIGPYIIDFYCPKVRLAVEIDGGQHNHTDNKLKDGIRTAHLNQQNIVMLRFWNNIQQIIFTNPPSPSLILREGTGQKQQVSESFPLL